MNAFKVGDAVEVVESARSAFSAATQHVLGQKCVVIGELDEYECVDGKKIKGYQVELVDGSEWVILPQHLRKYVPKPKKKAVADGVVTWDDCAWKPRLTFDMNYRVLCAQKERLARQARL